MNILIVEDDERLALLKRLLEDDVHNVNVAQDGETGLAIDDDAAGIDVVSLTDLVDAATFSSEAQSISDKF